MQVFAPDTKDPQLGPLLQLLENARNQYKATDMKAFAAFWAEKPEALEKLNSTLKIDGVGLTLLKGSSDPALQDYAIDTHHKTTVIVYKNRRVTASFVNYDAKKDEAKLKEALQAIGR